MRRNRLTIGLAGLMFLSSAQVLAFFLDSHTPNYDPVTECCDPATGITVEIDDG